MIQELIKIISDAEQMLSISLVKDMKLQEIHRDLLEVDHLLNQQLDNS